MSGEGTHSVGPTELLSGPVAQIPVAEPAEQKLQGDQSATSSVKAQTADATHTRKPTATGLPPVHLATASHTEIQDVKVEMPVPTAAVSAPQVSTASATSNQQTVHATAQQLQSNTTVGHTGVGVGTRPRLVSAVPGPSAFSSIPSRASQRSVDTTTGLPSNRTLHTKGIIAALTQPRHNHNLTGAPASIADALMTAGRVDAGGMTGFPMQSAGPLGPSQFQYRDRAETMARSYATPAVDDSVNKDSSISNNNRDREGGGERGRGNSDGVKAALRLPSTTLTTQPLTAVTQQSPSTTQALTSSTTAEHTVRVPPAVASSMQPSAPFPSAPLPSAPQPHIRMPPDTATPPQKLAPGAMRTAASVDEHVQARVARAQRKRSTRTGACYAAYRIVLEQFVFTLRFFVTAATIATGIILEYKYREQRLWENAAHEWIYFFACTLAVLYPLQWAEWLLFKFLDWLSGLSSWLEEVCDFARAGKGHLAHVGTVVFALLMQTRFFELGLNANMQFYFVRTCASLIFIKCGLILKAFALKVVVRAVYRYKHRKQILDVLFYEEMARKLSAPLEGGAEHQFSEADPIVGVPGTQHRDHYDHNTEGEERSMTPTFMLESESFWSQASYVKTGDFSIYDDADGVVVDVQQPDHIQYFASSAFDRLYRDRQERERRAAKLRMEERNAKRLQVKLLEQTHHKGHHGLLSRLHPKHLLSSIPAMASSFASIGRGVGSARRSVPNLWSTASQSVSGAAPAQQGASTHRSAATAGDASPNDNGDLTPSVQLVDFSALSPLADALVAPTPAVDHDLPTADQEYEQEMHEMENRLPSLTARDIALRFEDEGDAAAAYKLLDLDNSGEVTKDEFISCLLIMFNAWQSAKVALQAYGSISGTISLLASVLYWVATVLIVLAIFEVSFATALVPFTTLAISFSFAFGPTIQRVIDSLLFVTVLAPYDVGDRVNIATIGGGATAYVQGIHLLTTEFRDIRGKVYIARNSDLVGTTILNQRRSAEATFDPKVWIDERLTAEDFKRLEERIKAFLRAHPLDWRPNIFIAVSVGEPNKVELTLWVTHRKTWQEASAIWPAYSLFMYEVVSALKELGLKYTLPPQSLSVATTTAPGAPHPQGFDPTKATTSADADDDNASWFVPSKSEDFLPKTQKVRRRKQLVPEPEPEYCS